VGLLTFSQLGPELLAAGAAGNLSGARHAREAAKRLHHAKAELKAPEEPATKPKRWPLPLLRRVDPAGAVSVRLSLPVRLAMA